MKPTSLFFNLWFLFCNPYKICAYVLFSCQNGARSLVMAYSFAFIHMTSQSKFCWGFSEMKEK